MTKTCLVTGASSGIGRGIAVAFAAAGYDVAFVHWNDDKNAEAVAKEIRQTFGRRCEYLALDLSTETGPSSAADFAIQTHGHVDVLVNNAGLSLFEATLNMTLHNVNYLFGLNYRAPVLLSQEIARHMVDGHIAGSIINTASTRGFRAYPGDAVYGGLKAALIRSTQSMALDLAPHGIRVNCVAPGAIQVRHNEQIDTFYEHLGQRIPLGRAGQPTDIANAVVWLASENASYITGTTLQVDGGLILPGMPERVDASQPSKGWGAPPPKPNRPESQ